MNWETILCIGDSITIGARSYLGYPEYCGEYLSKQTKKNWNVINHAEPGLTTIELARSIDNNFTNLKNLKPEIATILVGTNDLKLNTSIDMLRVAYEQLVTKVQLVVGNNNLILIEIPKLMDGVMLPYKIEMNKIIIEYNKVIMSIAKSRDLIVCKMKCEDNYFYDGVHLNELGSESFGKQIADQIFKLRSS